MGYAGAAGAQPMGRPFNRGFSPRIGAGKLWAAYCTSLVARPLITKSMTSLAGFCLGDFIAQSATRRQNKALAAEPYDIKRTARLAFYGGCVAGPIGHYWFNFLDRVMLNCNLSSAYSTSTLSWCHLTYLFGYPAGNLSPGSNQVCCCIYLSC